jgi:hypothetical protein
LYHFHVALLPRLPPTMLSEILVPSHTESAVAVTRVAAVEKVLTFNGLSTHAVVLQLPSILAK